MNKQQHSKVQQNGVSADEDEAGQSQQTETENGNGEDPGVNNNGAAKVQDEDPFSDDSNEYTDLHSADSPGEDTMAEKDEFVLSKWTEMMGEQDRGHQKIQEDANVKLANIHFEELDSDDDQDIHHPDNRAHEQGTQLHTDVRMERLPYRWQPREAVDVTLYHDLHPTDIPFPRQVVDDDDQDVPHPDNGAHEQGTQLHTEVPVEGLLNQWQLQGFDDINSYQDLHPREMPHQQDMQPGLYQDLHPEVTPLSG